MAVYCLVEEGGKSFKIGAAYSPIKRAVGLTETIDLDRSVWLDSDGSVSDRRIEGMLHVLFHPFRIDRKSTADGCTEWFEYDCFDEVKRFVTDNGSRFGCARLLSCQWEFEAWKAEDIRTVRKAQADKNKGLLGSWIKQRSEFARLAKTVITGECIERYVRTLSQVTFNCGHRVWDDELRYPTTLPCGYCRGEMECVDQYADDWARIPGLTTNEIRKRAEELLEKTRKDFQRLDIGFPKVIHPCLLGQGTGRNSEWESRYPPSTNSSTAS